MTVRAVGGITVVTFPPEIDTANVHEVRSALTEVLAAAPPRLIVDLSGTRSCGASGLRMLLDVDRRARHARVHLTAVMPDAAQQRLLRRVAGVRADLPTLCPTLVDALADHRIRSAATTPGNGPGDAGSADAAAPDQPPTSVRLLLGTQPVPVTGVYVDEDTEAPCWIAVRPDDGDGERLLPFAAVEPGGVDGSLRTGLPAALVRSSPALRNAPPRLCDCDEDPVLRHYAQAGGPFPAFWPWPNVCTAHRSARVGDVAEALAGWQERRVRKSPRRQARPGDRTARA